MPEIETLLTDAGVSLPSFFPSTANTTPITDLIDLLEQTFIDTNPAIYACGIHVSGSSAGTFGTAHSTACLVSSAVGGQWIPSYDVQNDATRGRQFTGSWLVGDSASDIALPEPGTLLLGVTGILLFAARRSPRKRIT